MIRLMGYGTRTEGVLRYPERTVTAAETLKAADTVVYLDTTGGAFTATLPSVPDARGCLLYIAWVAGASAPTVDGTGLSHTYTTLGDAITIHASATGWRIL